MLHRPYSLPARVGRRSAPSPRKVEGMEHRAAHPFLMCAPSNRKVRRLSALHRGDFCPGDGGFRSVARIRICAGGILQIFCRLGWQSGPISFQQSDLLRESFTLAQFLQISFHSFRLVPLTIGDGCSERNILYDFPQRLPITNCALLPTNTIASIFRRRIRRSNRDRKPSARSEAVTLRVLFQPGTKFQITVDCLSIPAFAIKHNIAAAVLSGLSRLMNPDPELATALRPGFSNRKRYWALVPPSIGSKSGNS